MYLEKKIYAAAPWSYTEGGFASNIGMSLDAMASCPDTPSNREALMRFCTATLWGCVFSRSFKRHLKNIEKEIWRYQSLTSSKQPTDIYMQTSAWYAAGKFHWRVDRMGKCFHPVLPAGYRRLWNRLSLGVDGISYGDMVSSTPEEICRVWQGLSAVYDNMLPRVLEGVDAPKEYLRMGGKNLPGWISDKIVSAGGDSIVEAYMAGVEMEALFS